MFVIRGDGGGRQQERDGDPSVSVGGAGIDTLLLVGKRFLLRAFLGSKVLYRLVITVLSPLSYPPFPPSPYPLTPTPLLPYQPPHFPYIQYP